jgi:IS66 C-terminal element
LFAGSDAGARRWAIANTLIQTCKLSSVDPLAWLTDVLQRIVSGQTKNHELHTLLPWNWRQPSTSPPRNRRYYSLPLRIAVGSITCISDADAPVTVPRRFDRVKRWLEHRVVGT